MKCGDEGHLIDLFGSQITDVRSQERSCTFRFTTPDAFVTFFERFYGPTNRAFARQDDADRAKLFADLAALAQDADMHQDGGAIALPSTYLETIARRA